MKLIENFIIKVKNLIAILETYDLKLFEIYMIRKYLKYTSKNTKCYK